MRSDREIFLIWITRSKEQILFMAPLLLNCTSTLIYYDGNENVDSLREGINGRHSHVNVYVGRPKLDKIIDWIVSRKHSSVWSKLGRKVAASKATKLFDDRPVALASTLILNRLPHDAEEFNSCNVSFLLNQLPPRDRESWAILYCGNVPPVKKIVQESSKRWGFMYSEESFAW